MYPTSAAIPQAGSNKKLSAKYWHEMYKLSVDYRRENFDKKWTEVAEYCNASGEQFRKKINGDELSFVVSIPHVKLSSDRKRASLSGISFSPVIESDAADLPNYQTVQQMILRWGWKAARANSVLNEMLEDLCDFGFAIGKIKFDTTALDGRGKPVALRKDITNFYLDPNRRSNDIHNDCRWIFEVTVLPVEDAAEAYPGYSFRGGAARSDEGEAAIYNNDPVEYKDGYAYIARLSFVMVENGKKRFYESVIDCVSGDWVVPPYDNGLGQYDYFFMSLPLMRGHAYPEPPVMAEMGLSDLANVGYSIYTDDAIRTGAPMLAYHESDTVLARALEDPNANRPGGKIPYTIAPPVPIVSPRASKALDLALTIREELRMVGNSMEASIGDAPGSVRSGRGIERLQSAAAVPMKNYENALVEGAAMLANVLFSVIRLNVRESRFIPIDIGNNSQIVMPVNMAEKSQEYSRYMAMQIDGRYTVQSARVKLPGEDGGEMPEQPMSVEEAKLIAADNPQAQVSLTVNDIAYGNAVASVEVSVELSPVEKKMMANQLFQLGLIGPIRALKDNGDANPELTFAEASEYNERMRMASMVEQDPLMNALYHNPELRMAAARVVGVALEAKNNQKDGNKNG